MINKLALTSRLIKKEETAGWPYKKTSGRVKQYLNERDSNLLDSNKKLKFRTLRQTVDESNP